MDMDTDNDDGDGESMEGISMNGHLALPPALSRRTASRTTRQIEAFAEKLDRFRRAEGTITEEQARMQAAFNLAEGYRTLAKESIQEITKEHTVSRISRRSISGSLTTAPTTITTKTTTEAERRLQLEENSWRLLANLISIDRPNLRARAKDTQESCFAKLNPYSTDREIFDQFVIADRFATKCVVCMKWLEQTASSMEEVNSLISTLETEAGRQGWLYTKEMIKGQKRLRALSRPLEPKDPKVTALLTAEENEDRDREVITQLDPDAVVRQGLDLQREDQFHERATWLTCWKMLRYGEKWSKVRSWAQERLEYWRVISLCGMSLDPDAPISMTPIDDGMTRMMNYRSDAWREACSALANSPDANDWERAVYALLCGETEPAYKMCLTWDDYVYVYLNSVVLSRYHDFCKQFQQQQRKSITYEPPPAGYDDLDRFLQSAKHREQVGVEARNPYRTIQGTILSESYDAFFASLAKAVSKVSAGQSTYIPSSSSAEEGGGGEVDDSLIIVAEDKDALRISTHLYEIAKSLGKVRTTPDTQYWLCTLEYIANLERAELFHVIPLYASLLPAETTTFVLGQILIEITSPEERRQQVELIQKQNIDIDAVLGSQWNWMTSKSNITPEDGGRMLKRKYPGVVIRKDGIKEIAPMRKGFMGTHVSDGDEHIIRSFEWLRYVDGQWSRICELGKYLYQAFYGEPSLPTIFYYYLSCFY